MVRCIAELCAQEYSANILVDHSELDASPLSMEQIQRLAALVVSLKDDFEGRKCAHVAVKDIQFGLVRAWEIMVELNGFSNFDFIKMVFRNRTDAIKWFQTNS